jgi:long-chain fatty acid transport protein
MGRAGVAAANPCPDGSAIFFNPAGLAGLSQTRISAGVTAIAAQGGFTDDFLNQTSNLENPVIPVPNVYVTTPSTRNSPSGSGRTRRGLETK